MKKIISGILALVLVVSCCGCSSLTSTNNQSENALIQETTFTNNIPQSSSTHTADTEETRASSESPEDTQESSSSDSSVTSEPIPPDVEVSVSEEAVDFVEPNDADFVRITDYIPTAVIDLKYATEDNFTGQVIYSFNDAWLRYGTVKKLMLVADELAERGLYLKIWDSFRPVSAQFTLWDVYPDATFVANPNNGFSSHSRGNTIDITLVDANGYELLMPTAFDDFSALANRSYNDCDPDAASNAILLENLMKKHGFEPYYNEWWHYSDTTSYEAEKMFDPAALG